MDTSDQKSIFGVLVGLFALFLLWLWASGHAITLWNAATGQTATASGTNVATAGASSAVATGSTVGVPSSTAAIQIPEYTSIAGLTYAGAQSGGVSVTPTAIAASNAVPVYNTTYQPTSTIEGILPGSSLSLPAQATNWLSWLYGGSTPAGSTETLPITGDVPASGGVWA